MINQIKRILELEAQLKYHDYMYFEKDTPVISDSEYDILSVEYFQLLEDNPEYESSYGVGFVKPDQTMKLFNYKSPMLSVSKRKNKDDFLHWCNSNTAEGDVVNEEKLDGMALRLVYNNNGGVSELHVAHSKGDGSVGADMTHRLHLIKNIPKSFPSIRISEHVTGEVYCKTADFEEYVKRHGLDINETDPRSTVSGMMKRLHASDKDDLPLYFKAYHLGPYELSEDFDTYQEIREHLTKIGFDIPIAYSHPETEKLLELTSKPVLDYQIDGIVAKCNDLEKWDEVQGNQYWTYATCYKFPTVQLTSTVTGIDWSLSLRGEFVGTLLYEPVKYEGTTLRRAKLDYAKSYFDKGLAIGSVISVTKSNEIIPKLTGLIEVGTGEKLNYPESCPYCDHPVTLNQDAGLAYCNNLDCEGQLIRRLTRLTEKKAGLNIRKLGEARLQLLVDNGFLSEVSDLFKLTEQDMINSEIEPAIASFIYSEIQHVNNLDLYKWLSALGIPGLGEVRAIELSNYSVTNGLNDGLRFHNADDLVTIMSDGKFLNELFGLDGLTIGRYVKKNREEIVAFLNHYDFTKVKASSLEGTPVSITGSWNPMTRDMLTNHLREVGIILSDKVTKTCKMLLTGDKPSPPKVEKAHRWNIPVVSITSLHDINSIISLITK